MPQKDAPANTPNVGSTEGSIEEGREVFFYHMTISALDQTLPLLLQKSLAAGWKVCVRGQNDAMMTWLDNLLWTTPKDSFLAHAKDGAQYDAQQPVLLSTKNTIANGAEALISVGGAAVLASDLHATKRVSILFDGTDPDAVSHARMQWKELVALGAHAKYWSQQSGRWEMKASS